MTLYIHTKYENMCEDKCTLVFRILDHNPIKVPGLFGNLTFKSTT